MISIIIPVFHASKSLIELNSDLIDFLNNKKFDYEIIYVDDFSNDDSWNRIEKLGLTNKNIKGIKLQKNYGQHNALLCGIRNAKGDIIVTMDDDLQNPPSELEKILNKLNDGFDVIYGSSINYKRSFWRIFSSFLIKKIIENISGSKFSTKISDYRVFKSSLISTFSEFKSPDVNIDVLLSWATDNIAYVEIEHNKRKYSKSNYSFKKLILYSITMITGFSTFPLKLASILGLFFSLVGFAILMFVLFV